MTYPNSPNTQGQYPAGQYPAAQYPAGQYAGAAYGGYGAGRPAVHPLTVLGIVLAVIGIVAGVVLYIAGQQRFSAQVKHLATEAGALSGCATDLTFSEAGEYTLYYVSSGSVRINGANDGCAASSSIPIAADTSPPEFELAIYDLDGNGLRLAAPNGLSSVESSGVVALPYRQVLIPAPGAYRLSVGSPETGLPFAIGVGKKISEPGAFVPLVVGLLGLILGVGCALAGLASAGRGRAYGSGGYGSQGYPAGQYPAGAPMRGPAPGQYPAGQYQQGVSTPGQYPQGQYQPVPGTQRPPAARSQGGPEVRPVTGAPVRPPAGAPQRPGGPAPSYRDQPQRDPGVRDPGAPPTVANPVPPTVPQQRTAPPAARPGEPGTGLPPIVSASAPVDPLLAPRPDDDPNAIWRRDDATPHATPRPAPPPTQPMPVQRPENTEPGASDRGAARDKDIDPS